MVVALRWGNVDGSGGEIEDVMGSEEGRSFEALKSIMKREQYRL